MTIRERLLAIFFIKKTGPTPHNRVLSRKIVRATATLWSDGAQETDEYLYLLLSWALL